MYKNKNLPAERKHSFLPVEAKEKLGLSPELKAALTEEDYEGFSPSGLVLPIVTIRQKAPDDGNLDGIIMGGFKCEHPSFEKLNDVPEIHAVILCEGFSRVYFKKDSTDEPLCRSFDGITGIGNPGGRCKDCPLSQWQQTPEGSQMPCAEVQNYLCYNLTDNFPLVLPLKRTALSRSAKYKNSIVGFKSYLQALKIPLLAAKVKIMTEKCTGKGVYWRPTFYYEGEIDITQLKFFREIRQSYRENFDVTVREMKVDDEPDVSSNGHNGHSGDNFYQPLEATSFQQRPSTTKPDDDLPF